MRGRTWVLVCVIALAVLCLLSFAGAAQAYIYWTNEHTGSIGRANNDGTGVNQNFITGCDHPVALAMDGSNIYWINGIWAYENWVGRADLDGTNVIQDFITGIGSMSYGLAVNDAYIYWMTLDPSVIGRTRRRASLG